MFQQGIILEIKQKQQTGVFQGIDISPVLGGHFISVTDLLMGGPTDAWQSSDPYVPAAYANNTNLIVQI